MKKEMLEVVEEVGAKFSKKIRLYVKFEIVREKETGYYDAIIRIPLVSEDVAKKILERLMDEF